MTWSAITYNPYNSKTESLFAVDGTRRKRIAYKSVEEWGIDAPITPPSLGNIDITGQNLTGDYNCKYTWGRRHKGILVCESNPSEPQIDSNGDESAETCADTSLLVTLPMETDDTQTNCIRFYRTKDAGSTYYFDEELSYGTGDYCCVYDWEESGDYISGKANRIFYEDEANTRYYTHSWEAYYNNLLIKDDILKRMNPGDNVFPTNRVSGAYAYYIFINLGTNADADLPSTEPPTTHYRPPSGEFVFGPSFNGICFMIDGSRLYYCLSKQPEYWPSTYYLDVSSPDNPGLCGLFYDKHPYFLTKNKIYYISGTSNSDFYPIETNAKTGTQSVRGALAVEGMGIFHVGSDGVYLYQASSDYKYGKDDKFTQAFNRTFRGNTVNGLPGVGDLSTSWLVFWHNKLYFGYADASNTYPANILVFDLGSGRTSYMNVVDGDSADIEFICATVDEENDYLLFCDSAGYVWHMEDSDETQDNDEDINWDVESKDFTLQTRRHFPRWVKYDVDADDENCTATGTLYLDGSSKQTHTLTGDRDTKRRLVATCNGKRMSLRVSGSGPVSIHALEAE